MIRMSSSSNVIFATLIGVLPLLLVYLAGGIMCLIFIGRYPKPALFALIGCALLLLTTIVQPVLQQQIIMSRAASGRSTVQMSQAISILAMGGSIVRAGGFAMLFIAVFVGRSQTALASAFPVDTGIGSAQYRPPTGPPRFT